MKRPARNCLLVCLLGTLIGCADLLTACGQKGPLVLPDSAKRKRPVPEFPMAAKPANSAAPAPADPGAALTPAPPASPQSGPQQP